LINLAGGVDPNHRVLYAECLGCLEDGSDGALIFDLVVNNFGSPKLLINEADFTPIDITHSDTIDLLGLVIPPPFLSVLLVPSEVTLDELSTQDFEVKVMYTVFSDIQRLGNGEVVTLSLEATNIDGRDMKPGASEAIEVQIVMEEEGKMVILDAKTTRPEVFIDGGNCGVFCELFTKIRDWGKEAKDEVDNWGKKIGAKFRHCGQTAQGDIERLDDATETGRDAVEPLAPLPYTIPVPPTHTRPHHNPYIPYDQKHHHHQHNHGHHNHGHVIKTLYRIFKQVLVPIAIGIVAGMLVSLMGMIVGHFVVLAYQKAAAVWKGKKMEGESNVDEEEALLYKGEENYRDDVPPPEYDIGEAPEVVEKQSA